ncbi:MAG: hypothetical protein HY644_10940 [Acidobacteria bacterium]|nr:hypothetical protein [Acidobacteriota bacterium]
MRRISCFAAPAGVMTLFMIAAASTLWAEETETTIIARMGMRQAATYHYLETYQTRSRWIAPDIGYIDFGRSNYREFFFGGGIVLYSSKRLMLIEEGFVEQAFGNASGRATYFVPWTFLKYELAPRIGIEVVYFPYIPLDDEGRIQHVIERAKVEYDFSHFKSGLGYAAYQFADDRWWHKPFITFTVKTKSLGNFEFWIQKIPAGPQVQFRYIIFVK